MLHGQLEWRWIYLTTIYKMEYSKGTLCEDSSEFKCELMLLIYDLITLSIAKFNKCNSANIIFSSPFVCPCVKDLWTLLQDFIAELSDSSLNFWSIVSSLLDDLRANKHPCENFPSKKILLRSSSGVSCKNLDQFSIWIVVELVKMRNESAQGSYELTEKLIKIYLSCDLSEENLRVLLLIISDVIFDVWPPRSEILMTLWELFQRKINSPFFIVGQNLKQMSVSPDSGAAYLEKVRSQQTTKPNANATSYDMFLVLLGKLVRTFTQGDQKIAVQKILSRIYSKFPAAKLQALSEIGLHNILSLFVTLSISTNFQDIAKKVSETLLSISLDKINHKQQLMKGHMAMIILHAENQANFAHYLTKLMIQVNQLTEKSNSGTTSVLKIMTEALPVILMQDSDDGSFENGEHLLLDTWIVKYLMNATPAEQERVYEALTSIIQRIRGLKSTMGSPNLNTIVQKLFSTLLSHCKQTYEKSESIWLPNLTANLCLLAADYQHLSLPEVPKFETIFRSFLESNYVNVEHSAKFLTLILENREGVKQLDELLIIQHWIKSSVLLNGANGSLKELTSHVIKLNGIASLSDMARNRPEELLNSKEPLCTLLMDVGKEYLTANNEIKLQLIGKIYGYFSSFEKWALPILQVQQQQLQSSNRNQAAVSTDESVMRIYTFISITILHCSGIIYNRSKSQCFFNVAVSHFILPSTLIMNQSQPRCVVVSMYKVWPLLIEGISRLDYKNDHHIAKVLNDLIVRWAPLLKISTNSKVVSKPFLKVAEFNNAEIVELVFGKLAKNFIALQNRKPNPSACLILTVVEEVLHVVEGDEKKLLAVWKGLMMHVMEAAMLTDDNTPSQTTCYNLLERFLKNKNFETSQNLKEVVISNLKAVTINQLSYYSTFYFK